MTTTLEGDVIMQDPEETATESAKRFFQADILQLIDELKTTLLQSAEINSSIIQQIKDELASGKYQIDSELIAEKLLEVTELKTEKEPELA